MNNYRDPKTGRYVPSPANRTQQLIKALYDAFDSFNKEFAEGKLPQVILTIQNKGRSSALGWFGHAFWQDKLTTDTVGEINLSAEHISRGKHGCLETLLHEMAHLWNAAVENIRDCSGSQYHNKNFKVAAERFGLKVRRTATRGWAFTSLDDAGTKAIDALSIEDELFQGLKRRVSRPKDKRYVSLVVDLDAMDHINTIKEKLAGSSGKKVSQKHVVQQALQLLNDYVS
jgi:hypothetical protein